MTAIAATNAVTTGITDMKRDERPLTSERGLQEARDLGHKLMRLRHARKMRQEDAAIRAGVSRSTAVLIEKGDIGRTLAQVLRYLDAVAPGVSLLSLLQADDPSLETLASREATRRVRKLSDAEVKKLDF